MKGCEYSPWDVTLLEVGKAFWGAGNDSQDNGIKLSKLKMMTISLMVLRIATLSVNDTHNNRTWYIGTSI